MITKLSLVVISALAVVTCASAETASLIPGDAKPGECYAKVVVPATYTDKIEKVLVREASEKISIVPAKYKWVSEKVMVVPERKKLKPIPAKYKKVTETIEVKPASRQWMSSLKRHAIPVSPDLLALAKSKGVDINGTTPNTCYKEYVTLGKYKTVTEDKVVKEATEKIEIIPAKYEWVEKKVEIKPASKKTIEIPAVYETKEEKILVEAEKQVWKKGSNPAQKINGATGEIMCLVTIPAKYKTIKKSVLKSPATTKVVEIPAKYKTIKVKKLVSEAKVNKIKVPAVIKKITKTVLESEPVFTWKEVGLRVEKGLKPTGQQICLKETPAVTKKVTKTVLETPATTKEIVIPAEYKMMKVKKLVSEAKEFKVPTPAEYKTVTKREKVTSATTKWQRILCQTNMNEEVVAKIQEALNKQGFNVGKVDGKLGRATYSMLEKYQRKHSLATGGITYETLESLGIKL